MKDVLLSTSGLGSKEDWEFAETFTTDDGIQVNVATKIWLNGDRVYRAYNNEGLPLVGGQVFESVDQIKRELNSDKLMKLKKMAEGLA